MTESLCCFQFLVVFRSTPNELRLYPNENLNPKPNSQILTLNWKP